MNFLKGSYGFDMFSIFLIFISAILNIWDFTKFLGIALVILACYRAFSKDIFRRKMELSKFTNFANKILGKFGTKLPTSIPNINMNSLSMAFYQLKMALAQRKQYKIIKCPSCKQQLRLPRGKGKVIVTCKKCATKFDSRT